ncbi:LOW QUALITY PROTEIN: hypothetical protein CVT25_005563, partial [Psilocybe cyanescens]
VVHKVIHCWQAVRYNRRWLIATAGLGGFLELIGWLARAWSSFNIKNGTPYKIQATSLIFGPTPLLGADFMILGEIIPLLGQPFSRFPAKKCMSPLVAYGGQDILCLLVQGAGGGIAASGKTSSQSKLGTDIILIGIIFQLLVIIGFVGCASEFFHRFYRNKPFPGHDVQLFSKKDLHERFTPGIKWMSFGLALSIVLFFIRTQLCCLETPPKLLDFRSIYRIIELAGGWDGVIIHTQIYFSELYSASLPQYKFTTNQ